MTAFHFGCNLNLLVIYLLNYLFCFPPISHCLTLVVESFHHLLPCQLVLSAQWLQSADASLPVWTLLSEVVRNGCSVASSFMLDLSYMNFSSTYLSAVFKRSFTSPPFIKGVWCHLFFIFCCTQILSFMIPKGVFFNNWFQSDKNLENASSGFQSLQPNDSLLKTVMW